MNFAEMYLCENLQLYFVSKSFNSYSKLGLHNALSCKMVWFSLVYSMNPTQFVNHGLWFNTIDEPRHKTHSTNTTY